MKRLFVGILLATLLVPISARSHDSPPVPAYYGANVQSEDVYGVDLSSEVHQEIDLTSYRNYIIKLTENGSRWTDIDGGVVLSDANVHARNWIIQELEDVSEGRIQTEILGDHKSIVGVLPGWTSGDQPVFMVGGHYDSVQGAPGANDDGTGVAAALELARVMSQYRWPLDIYFCFWNSEEIGLWGSWEVASILSDRDLSLLHYFNVDMLLVDNPDGDPDEQVLAVYNAQAPFYKSKYYAYLLKALSNNIGINIMDPTPSARFFGWERSDHYSLLQQGYDQVSFLFESGFERDDSYHQPTDVWNNPLYNYTVATEAVRCIGAAMAFTMAYAPVQLTTMSYAATLQPGQSRTYFVPISTPTDVTVSSNWTGGEMEFSLRDPTNILLDEVEFSSAQSKMGELLSGQATSLALYKVIVTNPGNSSASYNLCIQYDADLNGDEILDSQQYWFDPIMFSLDLDADDLSDGLEKLLGTSRIDSDSDDDAMPDGWEYFHGLDPLTDDSLEDPDNDTVLNVFEFANSTDPQSPDSDQDSLPDGWEIENQLDPLTNDTQEDPDGDGFTNLEEFQLGQDPNAPDGPDATTTDSPDGQEPPAIPWTPLVVAGGAATIVVVSYAIIARKKHI
ncbi:Zn-dependent exopeptidase M28 [Candidatus Thorarchaeota archaeon]|nr:MAG: Zn-dependent exopeptidase M28 [Candidatus Thorarchaeota archaeon]